MIVAIQKYLWVNVLKWKLVKDKEFDNVMKERMQANVGVIVKHVELITYDMECKLWLRGVRVVQTKNTVLLLLGVNFYLGVIEDH